MDVYSHQQCTSIFFTPRLHQYLLFVFFLMIDLLTGVRRYFTVVLICIFLISEVQHLLICILGTCMYFLEKYLFRSSVHFLVCFLCVLFFFFHTELYVVVQQFSHSVVSNSVQLHGLQHTRLPYLSPTLSLLKHMSIESVMPSNHLILLSTSTAFNLSQHQGLFQ